MNKKNYVRGGIVVSAIVALAAFHVTLNSHEKEWSDVQMANIEALAEEWPPESG
jgi:hypothetical protein